MAQSATAASFDCGKASTKVEHIICENPEISRLDDELAQNYKAAIQDRSKANKIKREQVQWVVERNACQDSGCVLLAYEERLSLFSDSSIESSDEARSNPVNAQRYKFRLTKGFAEPVCVAYLKRLNTTKFETPPFCDRPESDAVPGFSKLSRSPLSVEDIHDLYPIIGGFMGSANQKNLDWTDINFQQGLTQTGQHKLSELGTRLLQRGMDRGEAKVWRYEPAIDIDNDGKSDSVEIWHGGAVAYVAGAKCGEEFANKYSETGSGITRQRQLAFVVAGNNDRLDTRKTINIFAHPGGGYRLPDGSIFSAFRPIGTTVGIFRFLDAYYFDTFFDSRSDFEDKRKNDSELFNTLGVFLNKDGRTRQVCEYFMADSEVQHSKMNSN